MLHHVVVHQLNSLVILVEFHLVVVNYHVTDALRVFVFVYDPINIHVLHVKLLHVVAVLANY